MEKVDLTLTLKEKQKEALDHILDHCFDKICEVIVSLPIGYGKSLVYSLLPHALRKRRDLDKGCVLVICPLNLIQSNHLRSLTQHDVPACSLSQDCRVNTASGLQHSVEDVKVGKFDLIFAHPEALFNTMEEEALLFDKGFQKLITAVVVIKSGHGNLDICVSIFIMCPLALSWKKSTYQHIETKTFRRQFQMHILE